MNGPVSPRRLAQLRIAALRALADEADEMWKRARAEAEPIFAAAADPDGEGISQMRPKLDGDELGLFTITAGPDGVEVDQAARVRWAKLHEKAAYHWYIDPTVLAMARVADLIRATFPELAEWRIRDKWWADQVKIAAKHGGVVEDRDGNSMRIATVTTSKPTGEFRYVPSDQARSAVIAAWQEGRMPAELMEGLGRLALPAPPPPAADPEVPLTGQVLPWSDPAHQEEIARKLNLLMEVTGHNHPGGGYTHDPATNEVQCSCGAILIKSWADATGGQAAA